MSRPLTVGHLLAFSLVVLGLTVAADLVLRAHALLAALVAPPLELALPAVVLAAVVAVLADRPSVRSRLSFPLHEAVVRLVAAAIGFGCAVAVLAGGAGSGAFALASATTLALLCGRWWTRRLAPGSVSRS